MFKEKKVTIYQKKDKESWQKIKKALKEEGIRHVRSGHYLADSIGINGIGGMVDPRDFGAGHAIDRDIYYIDVPASQKEAARAAARKHGLVLFVESEK
ncbi:MAG: hypothetical protein PUE94_01325 [Lachnospiraceae bacterium]|nr:hypothetical protein [Lachnospiraceae bacterium]